MPIMSKDEFNRRYHGKEKTPTVTPERVKKTMGSVDPVKLTEAYRAGVQRAIESQDGYGEVQGAIRHLARVSRGGTAPITGSVSQREDLTDDEREVLKVKQAEEDERFRLEHPERVSDELADTDTGRILTRLLALDEDDASDMLGAVSDTAEAALSGKSGYVANPVFNFVTGVMDTANMVPEIRNIAQDIKTGGAYTREASAISDFMSRNPAYQGKYLRGEITKERLLSLINRNGAGVSRENLNWWLAANSSAMRDALVYERTDGVVDGYKKIVGGGAKSIGRMVIPLMAGNAIGAIGNAVSGSSAVAGSASAAGSSGGLIGSIIARKSLGEILRNALSPSVSKVIMSIGAGTSAFNENANAGAGVGANAAYSTLSSFSEYLAEGLFGLPSAEAFGSSGNTVVRNIIGSLTDGKVTGNTVKVLLQNLAQYAVNAGEEGLEEGVTNILNGLVSKITVSPDKQWFGDGGVFDFRQIGMDVASGAFVGAVMGSVGVITSSVAQCLESGDIRGAAEVLNTWAAEHLDERYRPANLDPKTATAETVKAHHEMILEAYARQIEDADRAEAEAEVSEHLTELVEDPADEHIVEETEVPSEEIAAETPTESATVPVEETAEASETAAEAETEEVRADEAPAPETAAEESHGAQEAVSEATPAEYVADGLTVEQVAPRFRAMGEAGMSASDAVAAAKESGILWKDRAISDEAMSILMDAWMEGAAVYAEKQKPEAAEANVQDSREDARKASEKAENEAVTTADGAYTITERDGQVEVSFEDKPSVAVRNALKELGFRWHGKRKIWYGKADRSEVEQALREAYRQEKAQTSQSTVQNAENPVDSTEKGREDTGKSQIGGTMIENSPVYKTADTLMDAVGRLTPVDYTRRRELAQEKYHISDDECMALQMYVRGSAYEWGRLQREADLSTWDEYDRMLIDLAQSAFEKHPVFAGRTYRNLQFGRPDEAPSAYEAFLAEHSPGATVTWKAFSSASKDPNGYVVSGDKIIHLVLDGVRARDISETFGYPEQQEVVYLPGTRLIVTEIGVANDGHPIIYAKEIDENGNDLGRNHESEGDRQDRRREGNAGGKGNDSGGFFGIGGREEGSDRGRTGEIHEASHIHGGEQNGREEITQTAGKDSPSMQVASYFLDRFRAGVYPNKKVLEEKCAKAFGGTLAEGAYTPKDAYDALELAVNLYLKELARDFNTDDPAGAVQALAKLEELVGNLPTQTNRTAEQEKFQQFSTPPTIAYLAAWAANVKASDVVLEPSAGIGGLAVYPKAWGATVAVNELDERRRGVLSHMGFDLMTGEDARYVQDVPALAGVSPSVVLMNPPFSSQATTGMAANTATSFEHVEAALEKLTDGGRLVTVLGAGRDGVDSKQFTAWIRKLKKDYTVCANVVIDGKNYRKYGTDFNVRIVVIDKVGAHTGETVTGTFTNLKELPEKLKGVRDARQSGRAGFESDRSLAGDTGGVRADPRVSGAERAVGDPHAGAGVPVGGGSAGVHDGTHGGGGGSASRGAVSDPHDRAAGERDVEQPRSQRTGRSGESDADRVRAGAGSPASGHEGSGGGDAGQLRGVDQRRGDARAEDVTAPAPESVPASESAPAPAKDYKAGTPKKKPKDTGVYSDYVAPALPVKGLKAHPAVLVESSAMASVQAPKATYKPHLPQDAINRGVWSGEQMVNIVYAGQAHEQTLPNGTRKGYLIGDGTGVGKGRQIAGIIMDNLAQGRKRAVWVSNNSPLYEDAIRDWTAVGGDKADVMLYERSKADKRSGKDGILFTTYSTLGAKPKSGSKDMTTNLDKIVAWLGEDFDGVIAFDEAHNMANAIPKKGGWGQQKPAAKALAGLELQRRLPKARVVYVSATAATSVGELAYAERLGLWGEGTSFRDRETFLDKLMQAGTAGMELVARDMKAMGGYNARSISYDGVQYDTLRHKLTRQQKDMYDKMSDAWQIVMQNVENAMVVTGAVKDGKARGRYLSGLYGSQQRFYQQILCALSMPSVIEDIQRELDAGHSCVLQIVNTNEAQENRTKAAAKETDADLEELDFSPRNILIDYLMNAFPITRYEEYMDEDGNKRSREVKDAGGNPVIFQKAVAMRDDLISQIQALSIPDNPLDMLYRAFGVDNVAEITGRSSRVVPLPDEHGDLHLVDQKRGKAANSADVEAFQNGDKRILVFSDAGGTGKSYHADRAAKNQQKRIHYLIQPGWNATKAVQGFGRTHRSNQVSAPTYKLVTTDISGQARFISTIAKRLDNLGAMTKGQRQAGSGFFSAADNLESDLAAQTLFTFYRMLDRGAYPEFSGRSIIRKLGLERKLYTQEGTLNIEASDMMDVSLFLNRVLSLRFDEQNALFGHFVDLLTQFTEEAEQRGELDRGMENVRADRAELVDEKIIREYENGGEPTKFLRIKTYTKARIEPSVKRIQKTANDFLGIYRDTKGQARAIFALADKTEMNGAVTKRYRVQSPNVGRHGVIDGATLRKYTRVSVDDMEAAWDEAVAAMPEYDVRDTYMVTGALLPIWDRLSDANIKVQRITLDSGERYLGRVINQTQADQLLRQFGQSRKAEKLTGEQIVNTVIGEGRVVTVEKMYSGYELERARVSGENRIEIVGKRRQQAMYDMAGVIEEKIGSEYRYFIPVGEKGAAMLDKLIRDGARVSVKEESGTEGLRAKKSVSSVQKQKITAGMSDGERYEILKDRHMVLSAEVDRDRLRTVHFDADSEAYLQGFFALSYGEKRALLKKIGSEFGLFDKLYKNDDVELEFQFSGGNLKESVSKQKRRYDDFAKMLSCFDDVIANAVGVEVHNRNGQYKTDPNLKNMYVLVSAFRDGDRVIPVKLAIKEFVSEKQKNALYVAVALESIEKDEIVTEGNTENGVTQAAPSSAISIAQLFSKINPLDESFLKYLPDGFLDERQLEAKRRALAEDEASFNDTNNGDNSSCGNSKSRAAISPRNESEWTHAEIPDGERNVDHSDVEPVSLSELTSLIQERFGVHITFGHLRTRNTDGEYDNKTGGMRVKLAGDLPGIAHELGHHLEREFGLGDFEKRNRTALEAVLTPEMREAYKEELRASEGFAEFLRRYLLDRDGAELDFGRDAEGKVSANSLFYRFEAVMDKKTLADLREVSDVIYALNHDLSVASSKSIHRQRAFIEEFFQFISSASRALRDKEYRGELMTDAKENIRASITEQTRILREGVTAQEIGKSWYARFMTRWVDRNYLLYEVARAGNGNAEAYVYAQNAAYAGGVAVANAVDTELCDIDGKVVGESLGAILKPLYSEERKGKRFFSKMDYTKYDAFNEYLVIRHAPERMAEGMKIFGDPRLDTPEYCESRQAELEAEYPEFADMAMRLYEFQTSMLKTWAVQTGIVSASMADEWGKRWNNYVPLQRVMDDKIRTGGKAAKKSYANQKSPWHRAVGSTRDIVAPVDSIVTTLTNLVSISHRNRVMLSLTEALKAMPDSSFLMEKIPAHVKRESVDTTAAKDSMLEDMMENGMDSELSMAVMELVNKYFDDTMERFTRKAKPGEPDEITVLRNGKAELWQVNNRELFEVVAGLQGDTRNGILKLCEKLTRFQVGALTGSNLAWSLRSNIFRDIQAAGTYLMGDINYLSRDGIKTVHKEVARRWMSLIKGYGKSFISSFRDTYGHGSQDVYWKEMMALGGSDSALWASDKRASLRVQKEIEKSVSTKLSPFRFVSCVSEAIEKGPRYAAYKLYRESGADPSYAFYRAMDLTVNFKRGGTVSKDLTKVIPFFNASVQGIDRMVRYYTGQQIDRNMQVVHGEARKQLIKQRAVLTLVSAVIGVALAQILRQMDKEDYDRLSTYTKNNFWCIPLPGSHKFITIPKPRELTVLQSGLERGLDYILGDEHAYDEFGEYAIGTLAPPIVSDVLQIPSDGLEDATFGALSSIGIIGPAVEIYANKNFLGQPIIPSYLEDVLPEDQYKQSMSRLAYWLGNTALGRGLGLSPVGIDHFGESVLGGYWELHKSLLPLNGNYRDVTMGFGSSIVRNSAYSTDVANRLYDGREAAMLAYNSDPEDLDKKITYKWYETATSFYSRYGKLAKATEDGKQAEDDRLRALEHVESFLSVMESGGKVAGQDELESYVRATGDTSVMPGVMQTFIKYGENGVFDEELALDAEEYIEFQGKYNDLYWKYATKALAGNLTEEQRGEALQVARDQALIEAKNYILGLHGYSSKRYRQTTGYDDVKSAGVSLTDYAKVKQFWREAESDKDRNGQTVSGSKRDKVAEYIGSLRISDRKKDALYLAMGYSESTLKDTPWH